MTIQPFNMQPVGDSSGKSPGFPEQAFALWCLGQVLTLLPHTVPVKDEGRVLESFTKACCFAMNFLEEWHFQME